MKSLVYIHRPSFDPVSLLGRMRERHPDLPLIHIDRERATGWSYVPVKIPSILEDAGQDSRIWREGEPAPEPASVSWGTPPLLSDPVGRTLKPEEAILPGNPEYPPFSSGLVLLLPFEMGETWEPSGGPFTVPSVPAFLCDCREVVAFHAPTGRLFLPPNFDRTLLDPLELPASAPVNLSPSRNLSEFSSLMGPIRESLLSGEYFQLNISIPFCSPLPDDFDPLSVYARMRRLSRPLFGGFFSFREHFILSHSPEQLLEMEGRKVRTHPIAGTAKGPLLAGESDPLLRDPKLLAEHIMIVDLLRNDLGRVSRPGSVKVPRLLSVETYPHLRHLVSEITGEISERFSRSDVIRSLFPGGSVTGAPRIRVRKHTQLLEREPRNYYCGSLGFVSDSGNMDLSLLIRTLEGEKTGGAMDREGRLTLKVGAGIVADSRTREEYGEILLKAQAFREILSS